MIEKRLDSRHKADSRRWHYWCRAGLTLFLFTLGAGAAPAATEPVWPLNDTGIDWWADGSAVYLESEPADYPGQDATYGRDVTQDDDTDGHAGFRFIKLDANGNPLPASATSWSCVRDEVSGLTWELKTDDGGLRDTDWTYTWYNPDPSTNGGSAGTPDGTNNCFDPTRCDTARFVADVNIAGLCGASDWRLPAREELRSIVDHSRAYPSIDTAYFPDTGLDPAYWSSSPRASEPESAWGVYFGTGTDDDGWFGGLKIYDNSVRLVRGGQALASALPVPIRVTNAAGLYVRSGPGTGYAIVTEVGFEQEFVAFAKDVQGEDTWYQIHLPCGNTGICNGWVAGTYQGTTYSVEAPASIQIEVVNTAPLGLNIRAIPNGSVLDSAYDGQRFVTFAAQSVAGSGCTSPWYAIYLPRASYAESGWVCGDYLQLIGSDQGATLSLQGRVTLAGAALPGAGLTLTGTAAASTDSGPDGAYAFSDLGNGSYTITPALAGHAFSPASRAVSLTGASRAGLDFRACDPSVPLSGHVTDATADNKALVGVTVTAGGLSDQTDATGYYQIAGLSCATHTVSVAYGDYAPYARPLDRFERTLLDIGLTKESTVNGITDAIYGDPVNTATGNYVYQRRDLEIPGIGLTLEFDRAYNSREASGGSASATPLGYGWTHSYQVSLAVDAGDVTITWGDGSTETYAPDGAGGYTGQYGVFDTLTDDGDGTFTLTKRNRTAYQFDTSGRLAAIVDKNGNTVSLIYTGAYLTEIRDTAERSITLGYDGSGRINLITDPLGRTVAYAYDTNGDLISATDTHGNLTQYAYDGSHQILTVVDPRGNTVVTNTYDADRRVVSYQTDAKGNGTTYVYQELDRITTITDALGGVTVRHHDELLRLVKEIDARGGVALYEYDTLGNRIAVTDKNGNVTQYGYDERGNVIRKTDALGQVTSITYDEHNDPLSRTDALGNVTGFTYDANGNLIRTTDALDQVTEVSYLPNGLPETVKDARGFITTNAYDAEGNLTQVTDALGKVTAYTYDAVGRRLTVTDALGRITVYAYDANDNLESVTDALGGVITHTYDGNDNKTATTDRNGNTTQWAYDEKDLLIGETDAAGKPEATTYDALDRRDSRTDRRGFVTQYAYDAVGNLIEVTDALGNKTTYTYDLNGNRLTQTDALDKTTRYQYDALNRQTKVTDALLNAVVTTYDALGRVVTLTEPDDRITQNSYDVLGRLIQVTDSAGGITRYGYDANGNRTSVTDPNGKLTQYGYDALNRLTQVTNALGQITTMTYDAVGNRKRVTDALGHFTTYSYSKLNLLVKETDALGNANSTSYDPGGRVTAVTDANGRVTRFAYDVLDRLIRVTDAAKGLVRYGYDATGNRLTITDPNGHITRYAYDALGRRIRMTEPEGNITLYAYNATGDLIRLTKPDGVVIKYLYDALHRLKRTVYPDATSASFSYDANSNRIRFVDSLGTQIYAYDKLDRMTSHTDPFGNRVQYRYDANGNRTRLIYPDGKAAIYTYDALNRQIRATDWLGQITRYVYDAAGRMTKTINANGTNATYGYDAANRLTSLSNQTSGGSVLNAYAYTLDPVGNHASEARTEPLTPALAPEVVNDTHDKENRLTASNGVPNSFDANGNLTAKGADTYAYDFDNRLVQTTIGGVLTQYRYDALGNRYARIRGGVETRFVLDTNTKLTNVISETDAAGNPQAYNVYGQGLIARILGDGSVRQYHYDSRGSTIAVTDSAQTTIQQVAYDPFGRVANTTGTEANPFGFLGRYGVLDEGEDLSYIRARYYDSEKQRFVSKDVKRGEDRRSQTLNRYAYALNNPLRFVDISGLSAREGSGATNTKGASDELHQRYLLNEPTAREMGFTKSIWSPCSVDASISAYAACETAMLPWYDRAIGRTKIIAGVNAAVGVVAGGVYFATGAVATVAAGGTLSTGGIIGFTVGHVAGVLGAITSTMSGVMELSGGNPESIKSLDTIGEYADIAGAAGSTSGLSSDPMSVFDFAASWIHVVINQL